jgi:hypothetical protein
MKKLFIAACLSLLATTVWAEQAADHKPLTPQQQKMKDCNAEAKTKALKGADRKTFMKGCLSANGAPAAAAPAAAAPAAVDKKTAQREKMKTCNADAKTKALKGDERKSFMKECLSAN